VVAAAAAVAAVVAANAAAKDFGRVGKELDSQVGGRICNGLGIMRACLETQKLEQLEARMDEIADRVARDRTNAARERTSTDEAQRRPN
jgi:hypothetical protein